MPEHPLDIIERYCGFYFTFFWEKGGERRRAEGRGGGGKFMHFKKDEIYFKLLQGFILCLLEAGGMKNHSFHAT